MKGKEKRRNSRDQEQVCGIRNSDLRLWNLIEEPVQRGGGGAEWRGLGSADSRKTRVKFLIQAEIFGPLCFAVCDWCSFHTHKKLPSVPEPALYLQAKKIKETRREANPLYGASEILRNVRRRSRDS